VTSRREFLASAVMLLGGAGCLGRGGSSVETFSSGFVGPDQTLERTLTLVGQGRQLPNFAISDFEDRTGVKVNALHVGSDESLLLRMAAGGYGQFDVIMVGADALDYLVQSGQVEPLARKLVPNLSLLAKPFNNSPVDGGLRHDVPACYDVVGVAVSDLAVLGSDTWVSFFALAERHPGRVVVPDSADDVIGAALVSLGHAWDTNSSGDLDAATSRLEQVFPSLRVLGRRAPSALPGAGRPPLALLARASAYRTAPAGMRFYVPAEGGALDVRSYCIPVYAPHPAAAHAWLENWLEPVVEAGSMSELQLPVPLAQARALIDPSLLANQAICPPLPALANCIEPSISVDGAALRAQIWSELTG
jgi:spermidine/putrescine transport system substrate-binding protein